MSTTRTICAHLGLIAVCLAALACPALHASEQHGSVHGGGPEPSQSYLGVDVRDIGNDQVTTLHLKNTHGAEIIRIDHDGPAGKMGLHEHDVVLEMNGKNVSGEEQMRRMLRETPPGTMVVLKISRDGQSLTLSAPMADRLKVERQAWVEHLTAPASATPEDDGLIDEQPGPAPGARAASKSFLGTLLASPTYTGAMLEAMSPQLAVYFGASAKSGLLVRSVASNSPAQLAGLHAGDVVTRVNFKAMSSVSTWTRMIKEAKGRPVTLSVMRDHQERSVTLIPDVKRR